LLRPGYIAYLRDTTPAGSNVKPTLPNSEQEVLERPILEEAVTPELEEKAARERTMARLRLLWDQRQFLLGVVRYALLSSVLIAFLIPKRYESTARIMPPDTQSTSGLAMLASLSGRTGTGAMGAMGGLGSFAGDLLGLKSSSAIFVGILHSRTVEDRLIEQFDLKKVYWDRRIEDARDDLEDHTQISEDRKSAIVTVTVIDKDKQRATAMAKAYVKELDRLVAQVSTSAARRERIFLEGRLKAVKEELDRAAVEFSQFASKNTAIDIKEQGKAMVEAAAILQGQLIATQTELEGLRQIYTDNNVRVRAVRARISELQHRLEDLGGKDINASGDPAGDKNELYPPIRKLPLLGVTYFDLYRQTKIAETVYELLTQQYELAKVQEAKEIPTVKVLDVPVVPEKKSFPPRLLLIALSTSLALGLGMAWVLGAAQWDKTDPQDPRRALVLEVFQAAKAYMAWGSTNGSRLGAASSRLWNRLARRQDEPEQHE